LADIGNLMDYFSTLGNSGDYLKIGY
jgi:hypothetical protein